MTGFSSAAEQPRLQTLDQYELLEMPRDPALDDIARLAAQLCNAPAAAISIVESDCVRFPSRYGIDITQAPRHTLPCETAVANNGVYQVRDAHRDYGPDGIAVGDARYRFYAGAPIVMPSGTAIGCLSVLDTVARELTPAQLESLAALSRVVVTRLELTAFARQMDRASHARRIVERALIVERNFVSAVLDTVGALVVVVDTDGRIVRVNRACEKFSGYSSADLVGNYAWERLVPAEDFAEHVERFQRIRSGSFPSTYEDFWLAADGSRRRIAWSVTALQDARGDMAFFIVTGIDVTVQRVAEAERNALDRMKDEFISTLSHELLTPLTSLRGALGLVASGALVERPERMAQMVEIAIDNADRLAHLVNDVLELESIGSGKAELHSEMCSIDDLFRRASSQVQTSACSPFEFVIESGGVAVWADPRRILQALTNLISNAIRFSPQPGRTPGQIHLTAQHSATGQALIEVRDHGCGIPGDKLEMIFDRFKQVDASDSRAMGGTGLGLAICRSIVAQHGGIIWATSTLGKGSTFHFTLPTQPSNNLR